ncbi:LytTR family DNA-binding domain-containing protein [Mucilaginibacter sp. BJC16-A38]|uniref:LytR/AlgR family response regulator transcription factor n=1 Tax=Mucilaginibacter phenanthrenivorans TaxID=1234842 RepID=UPI002158912C|nr:LytTR family DNA-binding domain-containing protein [Mucilaginibacter phenanthrenivorans]MCR8558850.1 LytTR family DNA-binding domain-containing protein [Mucilaginibacter phenanthrenivorans]
MNCIIVDDEPLARNEMESLIREVSSLEILMKFSNAFAAKEYLAKNEVDLLFLDIEMPGLNGVDFAASIPGKCLTIFTTAYPQYALRSYELDAIDYLLKPIDKVRLEKAIRKAEMYNKLLSDDTAKNTIELNTNDFFFIKSDRRTHKLYFADILYIEGLKDYVIIYTQNQKLMTAMNLKTIHQKIPQSLFFRVSKSFLVNMERVTSFDNHTVYLGETDIPLGDIYRNDFVKSYAEGHGDNQ